MAIGFNIQFRVNEKTSSRVIRLTDTSTGFTLTKGNFSIVFPDGTTINHTDFQSPDITSAGAYFDFQASTDIYNNVLTGTYVITFVALDAALTSYTLTRTFDFNWIKPSFNIQNKSDVFIPEVQFYDATSYSPSGNFTGTLTRTFSVPFPTTCEASAITPTSTSTNTLTPVYVGKYYEGLYNVSLDVTVNYTNDIYSYLSIYYTNLGTVTYDIRQVPTQTQLVTKMNAFRSDVDLYKLQNDTQFEIMNEKYDISVALYSHLIARYETGTLDGSQPLLEELLSILEPYNGIYSYKTTQLTPFSLGTTESGYFTLSDGIHTDNFPLQSTLLFGSSNSALTTLVADNSVTFTPVFGTSNNTFAAGDDSRFHNPVTIGTGNGLSLTSQAISLSLATSGSSGAMSASDKSKLDGIASGATANAGTVTSIGISVPSAFTVSNSPITSSGTITIGAAGTASDYIKGNGVLGTLNTAAVAESTALYFTDARARAAISLTTTGTSGAATYSSSTGVLNIPQYQGGVTSFNTRTGAIVLSTSDITSTLGFTPENLANRGIANGYASLDAGGLVPSTQLPSYVDDVLEYSNLASFPITGTAGKIYVDLSTEKIYRWSGSVYIEISPSVGAIWGGITGTLSNQTDLSSALSGKEPTITAGTTSQYWRGDKTWQDFTTAARAAFSAGTGITITNGVIASTLAGGTVTSVGLSMPSAFTVTNSPVTSSGTLTVTGAGSTAQYINGLGQLVTFPTLLSSDRMLVPVRNATGATLYKGTVVYLSGSTGSLPNVVKAQANAEGTSAGTFGVIYADLPNNSDGQIVAIGSIDTLDTRTAAGGATNPFTSDTLVDGDTIYLSPTTAGYITNVKPSAPNHLVYLGKVTRTSPTNGTIVYRVQNGYELDELHDVQVGSYVNKDVLYRDTTTNLWKNASIATILGYTPLSANQTITLSGAVSGSGSTAITTTLSNSVVGVANLSATGTASASTYLRGDNTWATISGSGTVTSVAALTLGTTGTDLSSTVANSTTTPVITLNVPTASASNRGALSSADWTTFNSKQATITLTTTGSSGAATFTTNTLNIPNYTLAGLGGQASSTNLTSLSGLTYASTSFVKMTAAGTFALDTNTYYLSSNPSGYTSNAGTVTSVAALTLGTTGTDLSSTVATGTTTPVITLNVPTASASNRGALSSADWSTFNGKQGAITLTTTGNSGAATLIGNTLNIPQYTGGGGGTVTSVAALTIGTTGTDITSTVANGTSTVVITLNIPTASASNRGALSSTDWSTFNGKQATITLTTTGSSGAATFSANTLNIPTYTLAGLGGQASSTNLTSLSGLTYASASFVKMTAAGTFTLDTNTYYLSSNPNGYTSNAGTVTSVAALTLGTTGTDVSSTVATGTTTPVITLNIPTASASNRGALSSTDWSTFNGKQGALALTTTGSSGAATLIGNTLNIPQYSGGGGGSVGTVSRNVQNFTATAAQATFTISGGYTAGYIDVFVNGVMLTAADYTATNGTTVALASSLLAGDIVDVIVYTGIALSGTAPISFNSSTGVISISQSTTSTNGYLSSTDWNAFNSKQAALGYTPLNSANPTYTGVLSTGSLTYSPAGHLFALQTSANSYSQTIIQNSNSGTTASADVVVNNDLSTDTTYYGDFGINSSGFSGTGSLNAANNVYLTSTSVDLAIGTTTSNAIHFVINGGATDAMVISTTSQLRLPFYTTTSSFSGTVAGYLAFDSNGNILTTSAPSSGYTVTSQSTTYSATATSGTLIVKADTTTAGFTITLPTAVGNTATIVIKKIVSANTLTVGTTSAQTIDGGSTAQLKLNGASITLISDNANWQII